MTVARGSALFFLLGSAIVGCGTFLGLDEPVSAPANPDANVSVEDAATDRHNVSNIVDGGPEANAPVCDAGQCERVVFVTSKTFAGSQLTLADAHCNSAAEESVRPRIKGRKFKAWISFSNNSAKQRVTQSTQRYIKVTKTDEVREVAKSFADLLGASLTASIDLTQNGEPLSDRLVWTGTLPNGELATLNCQDWASGNGGRVGKTSATNMEWTSASNQDCASAFHIYCFEE